MRGTLVCNMSFSPQLEVQRIQPKFQSISIVCVLSAWTPKLASLSLSSEAMTRKGIYSGPQILFTRSFFLISKQHNIAQPIFLAPFLTREGEGELCTNSGRSELIESNYGTSTTKFGQQTLIHDEFVLYQAMNRRHATFSCIPVKLEVV